MNLFYTSLKTNMIYICAIIGLLCASIHNSFPYDFTSEFCRTAVRISKLRTLLGLLFAIQQELCIECDCFRRCAKQTADALNRETLSARSMHNSIVQFNRSIIYWSLQLSGIRSRTGRREQTKERERERVGWMEHVIWPCQTLISGHTISPDDSSSIIHSRHLNSWSITVQYLRYKNRAGEQSKRCMHSRVMYSLCHQSNFTRARARTNKETKSRYFTFYFSYFERLSATGTNARLVRQKIWRTKKNTNKRMYRKEHTLKRC